jgi:hypothetical protein
LSVASIAGSALAASAATSATPTGAASCAVFATAVLLRLPRFGRLAGYVRRLEDKDRRLKRRRGHRLRSAASVAL